MKKNKFFAILSSILGVFTLGLCLCSSLFIKGNEIQSVSADIRDDDAGTLTRFDTHRYCIGYDSTNKVSMDFEAIFSIRLVPVGEQYRFDFVGFDIPVFNIWKVATSSDKISTGYYGCYPVYMQQEFEGVTCDNPIYFDSFEDIIEIDVDFDFIFDITFTDGRITFNTLDIIIWTTHIYHINIHNDQLDVDIDNPIMNTSGTSIFNFSKTFEMNIKTSYYAIGYVNGYDNGESAVLNNPNDYSLYTQSQYDSNYDSGYYDGWEAGYEQGVADSAPDNYTAGYNNGYDYALEYVQSMPHTFDLFTSNDISTSYNNGYSAGYEAGFDADGTVFTIFNGILNIALVPINFFLSIFNFEILGINLKSLVSALLTVSIIIVVIRLITGKKE